MVRLKFKEFIKESELIKGPLEFLPDRSTEEGKREYYKQLASFPGNDDHPEVGFKKPDQAEFDMKNIEKPILSGGSAKEEAIKKNKTRKDNTHFGPSQFYVVPARLKSPSVTTQER